MLKKQTRELIEQSKALGWVLEPVAKAIMKGQGFDIPESVLTRDINTAVQFLKSQNKPVVAKAVSEKILHKTEHNAVVTGVDSEAVLKSEMNRLLSLDGCENVLIEQMVEGIELIIGAKNDYQFGPVIVFGIGGTSVEIYNDTSVRMAPLTSDDVDSMARSLTASDLITGYRGRSGVNMAGLTSLLVGFSEFVMEMEEEFESVDLNPVICTENRCVIADARIMLSKAE